MPSNILSILTVCASAFASMVSCGPIVPATLTKTANIGGATYRILTDAEIRQAIVGKNIRVKSPPISDYGTDFFEDGNATVYFEGKSTGKYKIGNNKYCILFGGAISRCLYILEKDKMLYIASSITGQNPYIEKIVSRSIQNGGIIYPMKPN